NPYAFAMNDPHNDSDPSGLDPGSDPWWSLSVSKSYNPMADLFSGLAMAGIGIAWDFFMGSQNDSSGMPTREPVEPISHRIIKDAYYLPGNMAMAMLPPTLADQYTRGPTTIEMTAACNRGLGILCMEARDRYVTGLESKAWSHVSWWTNQGLMVVGSIQ